MKGEPEYVHQAVAGSLERLGTDYIDLYYQHRCALWVVAIMKTDALDKAP